MFICKLCNKQYKTLSSLGNHIKKYHKIETKEYYDKFFKKDNEDICYLDSCNNICKYDNLGKGYRKFCSVKCLNIWNSVNPDTINKRKKTIRDKYGVDNVSQSEIIKDKVKRTVLKKYGVENVFQSDEIKEKIKKTNKEKYNVECLLQSKEIQQKIKQTNKEKYGVEYPLQNKEILNKTQKTNLDKYGAITPLLNKAVQNKIKETNIKKYNVEHYSQTEEFKSRMRNSILNTRDIKNIDDINREFWVNNFVKDDIFLIDKCCEYHNLAYSTICLYKKKFNISISNNKSIQNDICIYLNEITDNIIQNNRSIIYPYEIDIFLPLFKLGIEFDGLMFHSYGKSKSAMFNNYNNIDKYYHLNKTKLCNEKGIHLIHIFENEWMLKKDIVLSIIKSYCNIYNEVIYGRKCEIKELKNDEYRNFMVCNHIQGYIPSKIKLGLYYNNELVSIMSFGKSRYNKKYKWELLRFCNKLNTKIIGGASKLFKYFINNYYDNLGIISYCDRRYFTGKIYKQLGFSFLKYSEPNYYYFHSNDIYKLYHRTYFQKHKLNKILDNFDNNKTEMENMFDNGYRVIYDCGQVVCIYN